jgi:hypothetical protein
MRSAGFDMTNPAEAFFRLRARRSLLRDASRARAWGSKLSKLSAAPVGCSVEAIQ